MLFYAFSRVGNVSIFVTLNLNAISSHAACDGRDAVTVCRQYPARTHVSIRVTV